MRFNDKDLAILATKKDGIISGRLQYTQCKGSPGNYLKNANFRDLFFKLVGNFLFYYRISKMGVIDASEPEGVLVLVNYYVQPESDVDLSFSFSIVFLDELDKRHIFTARTEDDVQSWVNNLQSASYQHWSDIHKQNQNRIRAIKESPSVTLPLQNTTNQPTLDPAEASNANIINDLPLIALDESSLVNLKPRPKSRPVTVRLQTPSVPSSSPRPNPSDNDLIQF